MKRNDLKVKLLQAFPQTPEGYKDKLNWTLRGLQPTYTEKRGETSCHFRTFKKIAAIACAVLVIGTVCTFAIRPALAADIPLINSTVYALAPTTTPNADMKEQIEETIKEVLNEFFKSSLENIGHKLESSDRWVLNEDTLLAAYYLQYTGATLELLNNGQEPSTASIIVEDIDASAKAFRITADLSYDLVLDGQKIKTETAHLEILDTMGGLAVTGMSINGADYETYKALIMKYQNAGQDKQLSEEIANYNAFIIAQALVDDEKEEADGEKPQLTREETIEDIAAELMYQYWLTQKTFKTPDLSALIERNADTELFFLSLELQTKMASSGYLPQKVIVEKGYGEIQKIDEVNGLITAQVYVKTKIDGSVGEDLILSLKPKGNGYIVVAFDNMGESVYSSLDNAAKKLIVSGLSRPEALQKAYQDRLEEVEAIAQMIRINMEDGMTQDEARQKAINDWYTER